MAETSPSSVETVAMRRALPRARPRASARWGAGRGGAGLPDAGARLGERGVDLLERALRRGQIVPLLADAGELERGLVALARDLGEAGAEPCALGRRGAQLLGQALHLGVALGAQARLLLRPAREV